MKPIYLFADSLLLFWRSDEGLFLNAVRQAVELSGDLKAAYVGASNGDEPMFYSIFEAAMEGIGIRHCRMIPATLTPDDEAFIKEADIILLAGGDTERGWRAFEANGLKELIPSRYKEEEVVLIGISAGAVQLGVLGLYHGRTAANEIVHTFGLVPCLIGAHEEGDEWKELRRAVQLQNGLVAGIGVPAGGGMIYHPDGTIEPIRHPLHEITSRGEETTQTLLMPPGETTIIESESVQ